MLLAQQATPATKGPPPGTAHVHLIGEITGAVGLGPGPLYCTWQLVYDTRLWSIAGGLDKVSSNYGGTQAFRAVEFVLVMWPIMLAITSVAAQAAAIGLAVLPTRQQLQQQPCHSDKQVKPSRAKERHAPLLGRAWHQRHHTPTGAVLRLPPACRAALTPPAPSCQRTAAWRVWCGNAPWTSCSPPAACSTGPASCSSCSTAAYGWAGGMDGC